MYYIGIDLGGTAVKTGVFDDGVFLKKLSRETGAERENDIILQDIAAGCKEVCEEAGVPYDEVTAIGLATPGLVQGSVIRFAGNLGFKDLDAGGKLTQLCGKPVYVGNDANLAALGEAICGGGKGYDRIVMLTLGTGLGMGIVQNGAIYVGANGGAGEFGHTIVEAGGYPCTCGNKGCIECYTSATALQRFTKEAMLSDRESLMWQLCGGNIEKAGAQTAWRARDKGDITAISVVEKYTDYVSIAIANAVNTLQPNAVLIGGGVSNEGENLMAILREKSGKMFFANQTDVKQSEVLRAILGNDAGMMGAAAFAQSGGKLA